MGKSRPSLILSEAPRPTKGRGLWATCRSTLFERKSLVSAKGGKTLLNPAYRGDEVFCSILPWSPTGRAHACTPKCVTARSRGTSMFFGGIRRSLPSYA